MSDLSVELTQNLSGLYQITATKSDGTVQDLTGLGLEFRARLKGVSATGTSYDVSILKSSDGGGITITNPTGGIATLEFSASDTVDLPEISPGRGVFIVPCLLLLINGDQHLPLNKGTLTVIADVRIESDDSEGASVSAPTVYNLVGDGATHALANSGSARWIQFATTGGSPRNAQDARVGGSSTSSTVGQRIEPGDAYMYPPLFSGLYSLNTIYYWLASGDTMDVTVYA